MIQGKAAQTKKEINTVARSTEQADVEISRVGITVIGFFAALIGVWGVACFVGGLVSSDGPLAFVKDWFSAVLGL